MSSQAFGPFRGLTYVAPTLFYPEFSFVSMMGLVATKSVALVIGILLLWYIHRREAQRLALPEWDTRRNKAFVLPIYRTFLYVMLALLAAEISVLTLWEFKRLPYLAIPELIIQSLIGEGFVHPLTGSSVSKRSIVYSLSYVFLFSIYGALMGFVTYRSIVIEVHLQYTFLIIAIYHFFPLFYHAYIMFPFPSSSNVTPKRLPIKAFSRWMFMYRLFWMIFHTTIFFSALYDFEDSFGYYVSVLFLVVLEIPFPFVIFAMMRVDTVYWHYGAQNFLRTYTQQVAQENQQFNPTGMAISTFDDKAAVQAFTPKNVQSYLIGHQMTSDVDRILQLFPIVNKELPKSIKSHISQIQKAQEHLQKQHQLLLQAQRQQQQLQIQRQRSDRQQANQAGSSAGSPSMGSLLAHIEEDHFQPTFVLSPSTNRLKKVTSTITTTSSTSSLPSPPSDPRDDGEDIDTLTRLDSIESKPLQMSQNPRSSSRATNPTYIAASLDSGLNPNTNNISHDSHRYPHGHAGSLQDTPAMQSPPSSPTPSSPDIDDFIPFLEEINKRQFPEQISQNLSLSQGDSRKQYTTGGNNGNQNNGYLAPDLPTISIFESEHDNDDLINPSNRIYQEEDPMRSTSSDLLASASSLQSTTYREKLKLCCCNPQAYGIFTLGLYPLFDSYFYYDRDNNEDEDETTMIPIDPSNNSDEISDFNSAIAHPQLSLLNDADTKTLDLLQTVIDANSRSLIALNQLEIFSNKVLGQGTFAFVFMGELSLRASQQKYRARVSYKLSRPRRYVGLFDVLIHGISRSFRKNSIAGTSSVTLGNSGNNGIGLNGETTTADNLHPTMTHSSEEIENSRVTSWSQWFRSKLFGQPMGIGDENDRLDLDQNKISVKTVDSFSTSSLWQQQFYSYSVLTRSECVISMFPAVAANSHAVQSVQTSTALGSAQSLFNPAQKGPKSQSFFGVTVAITSNAQAPPAPQASLVNTILTSSSPDTSRLGFSVYELHCLLSLCSMLYLQQTIFRLYKERLIPKKYKFHPSQLIIGGRQCSNNTPISKKETTGSSFQFNAQDALQYELNNRKGTVGDQVKKISNFILTVFDSYRQIPTKKAVNLLYQTPILAHLDEISKLVKERDIQSALRLVREAKEQAKLKAGNATQAATDAQHQSSSSSSSSSSSTQQIPTKPLPQPSQSTPGQGQLTNPIPTPPSSQSIAGSESFYKIDENHVSSIQLSVSCLYNRLENDVIDVEHEHIQHLIEEFMCEHSTELTAPIQQLIAPCSSVVAKSEHYRRKLAYLSSLSSTNSSLAPSLRNTLNVHSPPRQITKSPSETASIATSPSSTPPQLSSLTSQKNLFSPNLSLFRASNLTDTSTEMEDDAFSTPQQSNEDNYFDLLSTTSQTPALSYSYSNTTNTTAQTPTHFHHPTHNRSAINIADLDEAQTSLAENSAKRVVDLVAIKFFKKGVNFSPNDVVSIAKETSLHCKMQHPNIVYCYGILVAPPTLAVITELCARGDLFGLIESQGQLRKLFLLLAELTQHLFLAFQHAAKNYDQNQTHGSLTTTSTGAIGPSTNSTTQLPLTSITSSTSLVFAHPTPPSTPQPSSPSNKTNMTNFANQNLFTPAPTPTTQQPSPADLIIQTINLPYVHNLHPAQDFLSKFNTRTIIKTLHYAHRRLTLISSQLWNLRTRLTFAIDAATSVAFVHSKQLLHRDIKSLNFFVNDDNMVKLADFGISKVLKERVQDVDADYRKLVYTHPALRRQGVDVDQILQLLTKPNFPNDEWPRLTLDQGPEVWFVDFTSAGQKLLQFQQTVKYSTHLSRGYFSQHVLNRAARIGKAPWMDDNNEIDHGKLIAHTLLQRVHEWHAAEYLRPTSSFSTATNDHHATTSPYSSTSTTSLSESVSSSISSSSSSTTTTTTTTPTQLRHSSRVSNNSTTPTPPLSGNRLPTDFAHHFPSPAIYMRPEQSMHGSLNLNEIYEAPPRHITPQQLRKMEHEKSDYTKLMHNKPKLFPEDIFYDPFGELLNFISLDGQKPFFNITSLSPNSELLLSELNIPPPVLNDTGTPDNIDDIDEEDSSHSLQALSPMMSNLSNLQSSLSSGKLSNGSILNEFAEFGEISFSFTKRPILAPTQPQSTNHRSFHRGTRFATNSGQARGEKLFPEHELAPFGTPPADTTPAESLSWSFFSDVGKFRKQAKHTTNQGTPQWLAPEAQDSPYAELVETTGDEEPRTVREYSYPVDIYALGLTLWEILCIQPMDNRGDNPSTLRFTRDIPFNLRLLLLATIDQRPQLRPTAKQIVEVLTLHLNMLDFAAMYLNNSALLRL